LVSSLRKHQINARVEPKFPLGSNARDAWKRRSKF
jgi:hypothetical protein